MTGRLAVIGSNVEAWLFAALAARLLRGLYSVDLVPEGNVDIGTVCLTPDIERAHRLLAMPPDALDRMGKHCYGIRLSAGMADRDIPYGRYGSLHDYDFRDQWLRLRQSGEALPLGSYSANAALMAGATLRPDAERPVIESIVVGWEVDARAYVALLKTNSSRNGVRETAPLVEAILGQDGIAALSLADGSHLTADLFVNASPSGIVGNVAGWEGNVLCAGSAALALEGFKSFGISATVSAVARLVNLLPRPAETAALAAEYRRLFWAERDLIHAIDAALLRMIDGKHAAPSLLRQYERIFRAAGLLPHDGAFFWQADQWLACFDAIGLSPHRHNPNADRTDRPVAEKVLSQWASALEKSFHLQG